ncbi:hypothetical protein BH23ACT8_BH23ACT8_15680 [soil metagenome]
MTEKTLARADRLDAEAAEARQQADARLAERWAAERSAAEVYDRSVVDRYDRVEAEARAAERDAHQAFTEALAGSPVGLAWTAWASARRTREQLVAEHNSAAATIGAATVHEGAYREHDYAADVAAVLVGLAERDAADMAAARAAERDQAVSPDGRPVGGPDPALVAQLVHASGCTGDRVEALQHGVACLDCTARRVVAPPPDPLPSPGSDAYATMWRLQPFEIARRLDPADRDNPNKNPLHPMARSTAPGHEGGRPTP